MTEAVIDVTAAETVVVDDKAAAVETKAADTATAETAVVETVVENTAKEEAKSAWGDTWRDDMAGGDDDIAKAIARYGSPKGVAKALRDAQVKISSGMKITKPDETDTAAMAEWRKAEGIPDAPTGYVIPEPIQKRLVDDDKPILNSFFEYMHAQGARSAEVASTAAWYVDMQEKAAALQSQNDEAASEKTEDALRKDWSHSEYKGNMKLASGFIQSIPGVGDSWTEARMKDGRRLGDIPEFISWAADQARASGMDTSFLSGDGAAKSASRKAEIEKVMTSNIDKYYEDGLDKELAAILEKETKQKK